MANTASAKKATRKMIKQTAVNKNRRTRMRSVIRTVEEAIAAGDQKTAQEALHAAQPEIMRGVHKGIMPKNTASRRISRLNARIKAMA